MCVQKVHLLEVCTSDCAAEGGGSECDAERSSMLLLLCSVFITLRGPALIMHGYTAPQTSQPSTGGEKKQHCMMTWNGIKRVLSPHRVCKAFYLFITPAGNLSILIINLPGGIDI